MHSTRCDKHGKIGIIEKSKEFLENSFSVLLSTSREQGIIPKHLNSILDRDRHNGVRSFLSWRGRLYLHYQNGSADLSISGWFAHLSWS